MQRLLRVLIVIILTVTLIVASAFTEAGSRLLLTVASQFIPGKFNYQHFNGTLGRTFSLTNVSYQAPSIQLSVKEISASWSWQKLFSKQFVITNLNANTIRVNLPLSTARKAKPANYTWLNHVRLYAATLTDISIQQAQQAAITIPHFTLQETALNHFQLQLTSNQGELAGTIAITHSAARIMWQTQLTIKQFNTQVLQSALQSNLRFKVQSTGTWNAGVQDLEFHLQDLSGEFQRLPVKGSIDIKYQPALLDIQTAHLTIGAASLTVAGKVEKEWHLNWQLAVPNLHIFSPVSQGALQSSGQIIGDYAQPKIEATLSATNLQLPNVKFAKLTGTVHTQLRPNIKLMLTMRATQIGIADYLVPTMSLTAEARYANDKLAADFTLRSNPDNVISGNLALPAFTHFTERTQPIAGTVKVDIANIANLLTLGKEVSHLQGKLTGNIHLAGQLQKPQLTSTWKLIAAGARINVINANLTAINAEGQFNYPQPLQFSGQFKAGKGQGDVTGSLDFLADDFLFKLQLTGQDLEAVNLPDYKITLSPNVSFTINNQHMALRGQVLVPAARIVPQDFSDTLTLPSEVVIVDRPQTASAMPSNLIMS